MDIYAVVTGDIVNSTKLQPAEERQLMAALGELLAADKHEFYRGDSFQAFIKDAGKALKTVLLCRAAAIGISETTQCDIRTSIGLGTASMPIGKLSAAKGEAFVLSGRAFDDFPKSGERTIFSISGTETEIYSIALALVADHIDAIFKEMTPKQAEVILELLLGKTQQEAADKIRKSKSTVSQFVSSAKWPDIEKLCDRYERIIKLLECSYRKSG